MATKRGAAKLLREAAKIVEKGWTQGYYSRPDGRYCAVGAILKAGATTNQRASFFLARDAMRMVLGTGVVYWNDTVGRTKKEVASVMRKTARALEHGLKVYQ